ncbi:alanine dehydrogenase [Candidatus Aerophobetes bacterium]|uniref:Alanine dehydrogenase n=1 Tax=Aerophobetes bacterium TaxID=2030807 RepID=A0A523QLC9_UNCAE|nr:MAG: alanine dehydrogenase [Candidatus Aerophobetes bacterium]
MIIGIPKEIKDNEYRVNITPGAVRALREAHHKVIIERGAGLGSGIEDAQYEKAGAEVKETKEEVFSQAEMIVKVKEPLLQELDLFQEGQILFTYLHLAANQHLTEGLLEKRIIGIAYETVELPDGSLPLLLPMSQIAGRMSAQIGAHYLEKTQGGRGILLGGVPGTLPARVTVLGGGTVGTSVARIALGMGAEVYVVDKDPKKLVYLDDLYQGRVKTLISVPQSIEMLIPGTDLLIGAVLIPGAKAPQIVTGKMIRKMEPGSVVLDVAIDQGGCIETSRPTSHSKPTFSVDGVIHYGVTNIPSIVARTSTYALSDTTFPYVLELANKGVSRAAKENPAILGGINLYEGKLTCKAVAEAHGLEYCPVNKCV